MTSLAPLSRWGDTAHGLHQAAQHLGALRMLVLDQVPNFLELSLVIRPEGLSTGPLPGVGEVLLDFEQCALIYQPTSGKPTTISLAGHTPASLLDALLRALEQSGWMPMEQSDPTMSRVDALVKALNERSHPFRPKREDLAGETPFNVDPQLSADYSRVLYRIFTAAARFRARLVGPMTPVVVWPEHFDLSFLWFATPQADDRHPHMNFGFAPFGDDIERPYLYAYAYPMPEGFERRPLPPHARWHVDGWQGIVFPYDELVPARDPEMKIEDIFTAAYQTLAPSLH